mgnify:CR=1 FL=1
MNTGIHFNFESNDFNNKTVIFTNGKITLFTLYVGSNYVDYSPEVSADEIDASICIEGLLEDLCVCSDYLRWFIVKNPKFFEYLYNNCVKSEDNELRFNDYCSDKYYDWASMIRSDIRVKSAAQ